MLYTDEQESKMDSDPRNVLGSFIRVQRQMANL